MNGQYPINPMAQMPNPYMTPYMNRTMPQNNGIIWVQGIEGAKAYQIPSNSNVILMDSDAENRFYIKTSDNIGMCNLRVFEYKEMTGQPAPAEAAGVDMSQYVTRDELNEILASLGGKSNGKQSVSAAKSASRND